MKKILFFIFMSIMPVITNAQDVFSEGGDMRVLKNEKMLLLKFDFDNLVVNDTESEAGFLARIKVLLNENKPGTGDYYVKMWDVHKKDTYEPWFEKLLKKYSPIPASQTATDAKYTLIVKTTVMSPGYGLAVRGGSISYKFIIVETATNTVVHTAALINMPGGAGCISVNPACAFSTAYGGAAKRYSKYMAKEINKK